MLTVTGMIFHFVEKHKKKINECKGLCEICLRKLNSPLLSTLSFESFDKTDDTKFHSILVRLKSRSFNSLLLNLPHVC